MTNDRPRRPIWLSMGALFEHDLDGTPIMTGGVCGRQAVAIKGTSREGEPMWQILLLNCVRDHEAALEVARGLLARQAAAAPAATPASAPSPAPKPDRPILKLKMAGAK